MAYSILGCEHPGAPDFARLAQAVNEWEPRLELHSLDHQEAVYDADATLYLIALSGPARVTRGPLRHADLVTGDLLVLPATLAAEVEPAADFLAIRHDGPPPYHFRERFLQVWGFEHLPRAVPEGEEDVRIARDDPRHRLSYSVIELEPEDANPSEKTVSGGIDLSLLVALEGRFTVRSVEETTPIRLNRGGVLVVGPGREIVISGAGRVGMMRLPTEEEYLDRARRGSLSPEWTATKPAAPRE